MEISTVSSFGPASAGLPVPAPGSHSPVSVASAHAVAPVSPAESPIQGEWLGREASPATSTDAYLRGTIYDVPRPSRGARMGGDPNRLAINAYLGHTRDGLRDASGRGRAVDYFV